MSVFVLPLLSVVVVMSVAWVVVVVAAASSPHQVPENPEHPDCPSDWKQGTDHEATWQFVGELQSLHTLGAKIKQKS